MQDGAHASIFRRKGIKMGRMLRSFSGKESRWGACFDLSHLRKSELHLAADYADLPDFNPLNPRNPRLNSRFKSEKIAALMAERVVHEVLETKPHNKVTNAASESLNAKIQWVKYTARRFRNHETSLPHYLITSLPHYLI